MKTNQFSFRKRAASFRFAFRGIISFFREEHNAQIHLAGTIAVAVVAWRLNVSLPETVWLIIVTGFVWAAELFNTAIERIMDFVSPGYHPDVKLIKNLSAAAVLFAALTAIVTGAIIFIPKFF